MLATLEKPNYRRAKSEASRLLGDFGIDFPPVDPVTIARNLGMKVVFVEFDREHDNISGFYDPAENSIYVNSEEFALRQTFTIAHELGHKILHEEWAKSADYKILYRDQLLADDDPHEKEANAFAANLLVPRSMLDLYWDKLSLSELSKLFAVSVPVIKNRLSFEYGI
ncbi:ImmA/IrrE family metallo-endopeptidase [Bradyrhizobium sp. 149]|uniref:ImmA/IrrE family metallo-endopeptidase n=1 Tax=Bradyrhizobium sp. 149 TaxID=2782624 RepID=UPI001FF921B4|nr:ImmA/IrrE family metallo-endopeptidase [Bradyrhizobium sp. 149]MCK1650474.1 ImmA/IrrE family metallo-endopeptidase [Bradyrhizobium sp. 149]